MDFLDYYQGNNYSAKRTDLKAIVIGCAMPCNDGDEELKHEE